MSQDDVVNTLQKDILKYMHMNIDMPLLQLTAEYELLYNMEPRQLYDTPLRHIMVGSSTACFE